MAKRGADEQITKDEGGRRRDDDDEEDVSFSSCIEGFMSSYDSLAQEISP